MKTRLLSLVSLAVLAVLVGACSGSSGAQLAAGSAPAGAPGPDLQTFTAMLEPGIMDFNGPDPATPGLLADKSELIVTATLQSVRQGPSQGSGPGFLQYAVVEATVTKIYKGNLPEGAGGTIYVAAQNPGVSATVLDSLLPRGTPAVLYLETDKAPGLSEHDPQAGRPAGQPLYWDAWPGLGFIVQFGDHTVLRTGDSYQYPTSLSDYLPDRPVWPPDSGRVPMVVNRSFQSGATADSSSSSK